MKPVSAKLLIGACLVSLAVGFFIGVGATAAGRRFLASLVERERPAEVGSPASISRDRFSLEYPANWKIDKEDKDYDPDHLFSVDSPGSAFVMFVIASNDVAAGTMLKGQVDSFTKLMGKPSVSRFDRFGRYTGEGAVLKGRVLGVETTAKAFAVNAEGLTVVVVQQCPDEDLILAQDGLNLIEKSFVLKPAPK